MNVEKVVAALKSVGQLACGVLVNSEEFGGGRCAIGQLFFAAGKTDQEIQDESFLVGGYNDMFDGLLAREYDLNRKEVASIFNKNDETDEGGSKLGAFALTAYRLEEVVRWLEAGAS